MGTAALVVLALLVASIVGSVVIASTDKQGNKGGIAGTFAVLAVILFLVLLVVGWLAIAPEYRLHKANIEKRIIVTTAKAEADADTQRARGEINRAKGTAEANKIVAHSITEPYLRYLYINNLAHTKNQIVYLPTEAGLPILEAGKR